MLSAAREALNLLLSGIRTRRKPAVRRASDDDWMFATDLPLAADEAGTERFVHLASADGWRVGRTENGWLLLDRPSLIPGVTERTGALPPGEAGALISLLERHPSDTADERALRAVAKAAEEGAAALDRLCARLHADWAEKLRGHEKLPGALLPYLCAAAKETEEKTC